MRPLKVMGIMEEVSAQWFELQDRSWTMYIKKNILKIKAICVLKMNMSADGVLGISGNGRQHSMSMFFKRLAKRTRNEFEVSECGGPLHNQVPSGFTKWCPNFSLGSSRFWNHRRPGCISSPLGYQQNSFLIYSAFSCFCYLWILVTTFTSQFIFRGSLWEVLGQMFKSKKKVKKVTSRECNFLKVVISRKSVKISLRQIVQKVEKETE